MPDLLQTSETPVSSYVGVSAITSPSLKPGWKTTEGWMTFIAMLPTLLVAVGLVPRADEPTLDAQIGKIAAGVLAVVALVKYIHSRQAIKTAALGLIMLASFLFQPRQVQAQQQYLLPWRQQISDRMKALEQGQKQVPIPIYISPPQQVFPQTSPQIQFPQTPPQIQFPQTLPQQVFPQTPPQQVFPQSPPQQVFPQTPQQQQLVPTPPQQTFPVPPQILQPPIRGPTTPSPVAPQRVPAPQPQAPVQAPIPSPPQQILPTDGPTTYQRYSISWKTALYKVTP